MVNRNSAETQVPITPPTAGTRRTRFCNALAAAAMATGRERPRGGVAEREEEADPDRSLAFLHQLAGDVVDGGDVIGIHRMAQPESIGQQRGAEEHGGNAETPPEPRPRRRH